MRIANLENNKRKIIANVGNLAVLEYVDDASVSPANAMTEYFTPKSRNFATRCSSRA